MTDTHRAYADAARYRLERPTAGPTERPVVMLHGLGGDKDQLWRYVDADVAPARLAPDLRGHGETPLIGSADDFSFPGLTEDLLALLDRLTWPASTIVGVSMGAGIAVSAALLAPERVSALILVRPAWGEEMPVPNLAALEEVGRLLADGALPEVREHYLRSERFERLSAQSPSAARAVLEQFGKPDAVARRVRLTSMPRSRPFGSYADLAAIRVPTLVIGTDRDFLHPLRLAREWFMAIPNARFRIVPARDADETLYEAAIRSAITEFLHG
jgi:pimeloyl-ACP methyl ester carboxylesterase